MNKRPVILRTVIAVVVVAVFALSIYPLTPRDFYKTFSSVLKKSDDPVAVKLITEARKKQEVNKDIFPSVALLQAADEDGIALKDLVKGKDLNDNRDVVSLVRKKASSSIRLGLDLNGGVEFLLELVPDGEFIKRMEEASNGKDKNASKDAEKKLSDEFNRYRDIAIEVLRKRLEGQKIFEAEISPAGGHYVSLRVPVVSKEEKIKLLNLIKMSAKLRFRLVHPENERLVNEYLANPKNFIAPVGYEKMEISEFSKGNKPVVRTYFIDRRWLMDGRGIVDAFPTNDQFGQKKIILRFDTAGAKQFGRVTSDNINRQLAIVLDGKLYCAPSIRQAIMDGSAEISGNFSNEESKNISDALVSGSLPFQINVKAIFDTDPTLGADNVTNGIWAGILAMLVVVLFITFYYLRAGLVAVAALGINLVLVLGALAAFDATLTLPGIAGIILTIGMAVDANVLIFERIREEMEKGKGLQNAIDLGYGKAFTTILDSNLTTLFTAVILLWVGTGPVKGFAVALSIGIVTSMFSALFLTRLFFDYIERMFSFKTMKMNKILSQPSFDFLGKRHITFGFSAILIIASLVFIGIQRQNILSVDFTGGTQITFDYDYSERVPQLDITKALADAGYVDTKVSYKTNVAAASDNHKLEILIRGDAKLEEGKQAVSPKADIAKLLNQKFPKANLRGGQESSLGGLIGMEFSKSAILALILSFVGIVIYVSIRFEFAYAIAAVLALIHDVIICTGIFVMFDRDISLQVIAAILTIVGYSINDTIVIFDRIREDLKLIKNKSYKEIINISINQTLSRTLLTSATTLMVLVVLFFCGGIAINDFVLVMLLGVLVGTYSSI
ncbi:MAG: protein translocase subunit SecD, partial [Victivallaceae bacterium]